MRHVSRLSSLVLTLCLPAIGCDSSSSEDSGNAGASEGTGAIPTPGGTADPATPDDGVADTGGSTPPAGTTGMSSEETTDPGGDGPSNLPVLDVNFIPDAPELIQEECGEVDFLFVIDNSGSMGDEQASLVANFPAFINGIQTVLESVESYHVGVVTSDQYNANIAGCQQLSSLVVQTGGFDSSNMACGPYVAGDNFMTEFDDLSTSFSCAAQVGTQGDATERMMQATVEAVQAVDGGPGQCNDDFIRDEALLVVVLITDEPDVNSIGNSMTWYDDILAAKAGIPENVVVVSFINTLMGGCPGTLATEIGAFTDMWEDNGFQVPICAPDYAPFFQEAVGIIDVACDNFIPPA